MRLLIHDYAGHPFQIQLSRELARRGHAVVHAFACGLLTPRGNLHREPSDPASLEIIGVPMDPNYRRDKYRFLRRRQMELDYGHQGVSLIETKQPDIVISANTPTEPQLNIAKACTRRGIRFVPWIQDFYSVAVAKLARKKLPVVGHVVAWWYRHLEKLTLRQASALVAITGDFVPMLESMGVPREKIVVIPNWAPLEELPQKPRQNAWSAAQDLDDKFVFLYTGTLAMKHNPDLLRQLAASFLKDSAVRIVVVSEGPGADYLRDCKMKEMLDNLALLPFQDFGQMPEILASAEVLVAVLETDAGIFSVPSKIQTYHCAGRPVLGSIPSNNLSARIITEEQSGICVEPADASGFLQAAHAFRANESLRGRMGGAGRAYAEKNFDIKRIADRFEECFGMTGSKNRSENSNAIL